MTNNPYTGKARYDAWNFGYENPTMDNPYLEGSARFNACEKGREAKADDEQRRYDALPSEKA